MLEIFWCHHYICSVSGLDCGFCGNLANSFCEAEIMREFQWDLESLTNFMSHFDFSREISATQQRFLHINCFKSLFPSYCYTLIPSNHCFQAITGIIVIVGLKLWCCGQIKQWNSQKTCFNALNPLARTKPSVAVGVCFVSGGRLVNTYCELHFRSIQLIPIVLFRNLSILDARAIISKYHNRD